LQTQKIGVKHWKMYCAVLGQLNNGWNKPFS
jgi:hypothetical protein